jgi:hypothetical protein
MTKKIHNIKQELFLNHPLITKADTRTTLIIPHDDEYNNKNQELISPNCQRISQRNNRKTYETAAQIYATT